MDSLPYVSCHTRLHTPSSEEIRVPRPLANLTPSCRLSHFACHGGCRLLFHIVLWTELGPRGPWWHKGGISEGLWELGRAADHESLSPEWIYRALQRCGWRLGIDAASSVCVELELYLRDSV